MIEVSPVVDARLMARGSAKNFGLPSIEMGVEVDDGDRSISAVHTSEEREGYGVVATKRDHTWECLAFLRDAQLLRIRRRLSHQKAGVAFFDLVECVGIIVAGTLSAVTRRIQSQPNLRSDRYIAAIEYSSPAIEGVCI